MAKLPSANDSSRLIPRNTRPIASPSISAMTAPAQAMEDMGSALIQSGERLYQIEQEKKREEEAYKLADAKNEFLRKRLQLEREIPRGDLPYDQWKEAYDTAAKEAQSEIAATLDPDIAKEFNTSTDTQIIRGQNSIDNEAYRERIVQGRNSLEMSLDEDLDSALGAETSEDRMEFLRGINEQIDAAAAAGYISPIEAKAKKKDLGETYARRRLSMLPAHQRITALQSGRYGEKINPYADAAMSKLEYMWGSELNITSAHRTYEHNKKVGGAENSQHLHGKAFDVDVSHLSQDERIHLIRQARAAGFSGIGVYKNSLHFDVGPDRAWGADYMGESLPAWARDAVAHPVGEVDAPSVSDMYLPEYLPADEVSILLEKANDEFDRDVRVAETEYIDEFDNYIDAVRGGVSISSGMIDRFDREAVDMSIMDPETREIMQQVRDDAYIFRDNMERLKTMSLDEIAATTEDIFDFRVDDDVDAETVGQRMRDASSWQQAVQQTLRAREDDPAGYVVRNSPKANEAAQNISEDPVKYAQVLMAEQMNLGIPSHQIRLLSDTMVDEYARSFSGMELDEAAQSLSQFKARWGRYGDRMTSELMASDNFPAELSLAMRFADDPALAADIISLSRTTEEELKENIPTTEVTQIDQELSAELEDYMSAFEAGDITGAATKTFNQSRAIAYKMALRHRRMGDDPSSAVEKAVGKLFPETAVNQSQMKLIIPEEYNPRRIESELDRMMSVDQLREANVIPLDDPDLPEFADLEVVLNSAASQGVWVNNSTGDGAILMLDVDGFFIPLMVEYGHPGGQKERGFYEYRFDQRPSKRVYQSSNPLREGYIRKGYSREGYN